MSGHSKWSTIKHAKGIADAQRGKLFSMLSKNISIAVKEGGSDDPDFNPKLRMVIDKAKAANMPKDKIKNAIDKGAGRIEGATYETATYEGFGPHKVAFIVECVTDNKNRTTSELKKLISKSGGTVGSQGSVAYFFDKKGVIELELTENQDPEEQELLLIDYGVEDIQIDGKNVTLIVEFSQTHSISEKLKGDGYNVTDAEVKMLPNTWIDLEERAYQVFSKFYEIVDEYEDVQNVYHNARKKTA